MPSVPFYVFAFPGNKTNTQTGDLEDEQQVLAWLLEFRDTADDEDSMRDEKAEIEDVSARVLEALIESTDILAVLFCKCTLCMDEMICSQRLTRVRAEFV